MKGLSQIPSQNDLIKSYNELQSLGLNEISLLKYFQWVRFDPRLGEILVQKLLLDWKSLNPFLIYQGLQDKDWPSVMGVLLDSVQIQILKKDVKNFQAWKSTILYKMRKTEFQQFFIGLSAFAGKKVRDQVESSNTIFKRWNYYGNQLFFNKEKNKNFEKSLYGKTDRLSKLDEFLLKNKSRITVNDYLKILPIPISRRLAEMDLKNHPSLAAKGYTKNRYYIPKKN